MRSLLFQAGSKSILLLLLLWLAVPAALGAGVSEQQRIGFDAGDQWEPAIAADGYGHVYVLYPQYGVVPGCPACALPSLVLVTSDDNGASWQAPRLMAPHTSGQFDPQIVADPADHRTLYAAWVQNHKTDVVLAKSADFGQSWSLVTASRRPDSDKPVLAVRGADVYIAFNHARQLWIASSHDGGITFLSSPAAGANVNWALPGGGTVDVAGNVYFGWAGYVRSEKGKVNLYASKSPDQGKTWSTVLLDASAAPPDCAQHRCGWSYLGAQVAVTSDSAGTLYALWNSGSVDRAPERIYFASSTTAGATWSPKRDISTAPPGAEHAFPAITAGAAGDVRIAWMDTRNSPRWNTWYRNSTNGGATWSAEVRLSSAVTGYSYIQPDGFNFPFGDYFGLAIDSRGQTHGVWGEGLNFLSPGSIWHAIVR